MRVNTYWRFAASADPNGAGAGPWPRYDGAYAPHAALKSPASEVILDEAFRRCRRCEMWDALQ